MIETPELVTLDTGPIAIIHVTVARDAIQSVMGPGIAELHAVVAAQGIASTGPWFTHHLRMAPDVFDFEIGVPVAAPVVPAGRVLPGVRPAARVARTTYRGGYEGLGAAWGAFERWLSEEGHVPDEDLWEVYLVGPESGPDPAGWCTQLNRPVRG